MDFYRSHKTQIWAAIRLLLFVTAIGLAIAYPNAGFQFAIVTVPLGTLTNVAVLGATTVTNTGPSVVRGDLDLSPGTSITGFPPGTIIGTRHQTDAQAAAAQVSLTAAKADAGGRGGATPIVGDLGGQTLTTGVYSAAAGQGLTGDLTLNGSASDVWIFQIGTALTVAGRVLFTGGAQASNVFWDIGSSATIGAGSTMAGTIMALASVTLVTGASLNGRALASTGAVTMDTNNITTPGANGFELTCGNPPDGYIAIAYSHLFPVSGGTSPYVYSIASGVLPTGLSLNVSTGVVSGAPTVQGLFTFTINATDSAGFSSPVVCSIRIRSTAQAGNIGAICY